MEILYCRKLRLILTYKDKHSLHKVGESLGLESGALDSSSISITTLTVHTPISGLLVHYQWRGKYSCYSACLWKDIVRDRGSTRCQCLYEVISGW